MFAYVGSFTTPDRNGRGNGINVFAVDPASGAWSHVQTLDGLENPSFLVTSADQRFLYAVHGGRDFATAHTEFLPVAGERAGQVGRQSQTWIRTPQGWKISSAHVSFVA